MERFAKKCFHEAYRANVCYLNCILEPEVGAKRVNMSLDDFADAMQKAGYKIPEMV